tara:strand:- start:138 stop:353 length:216 start_codon:yes stop_codon:yes gene_type:complete
MDNKDVAYESLIDVTVGLIIAVPIAYGVLKITSILGMTMLMTSIVQTLVFTVVAFTRKFFIRLYFKRRNLK